jgi:acyl-CoA thioesterase FadM
LQPAVNDLAFIADNLAMLFKMLRVLISALWKKPLGVQDTLKISRIVSPFDLDLNLHMNHVRFLSIVEAVLFEGLHRSSFLRSMLGIGAVPMIGGVMISYRKELKLFQSYSVELKYLGADKNWHVFAFCFQNLHGQVVAYGYVKGGAVSIRGASKGLIPSATLWAAHKVRHPGLPAIPTLPEDAQLWLTSERLAFKKYIEPPER